MLFRLLTAVGVQVDSTDVYYKPALENVLRYRREPFPLILYLFVGVFGASCIVTWFPMSFERGLLAYIVCLGISFWKAIDDGGEFSKVLAQEMRRLRAEAEAE
jgi:hypothetical protein